MDSCHPLRVCMLTPEVHPYAAVGGLADVISALTRALRRKGMEVRIFSPLYRFVCARAQLKKVVDLGEIALGPKSFSSAVYVDVEQDPTINYFIAESRFFDRPGVYTEPETGEGYEDNFERFNFFVLASLEALFRMDWKPHLLHCHDCHTALAPAYLKLGRMGLPFFNNIASVLTVHNLAYQGVYPAEKFPTTNLPGELFYPLGPFEFYGQINSMKAGLCYADVINTVSPQYAREIQTPEYGCGLDGVLRRRQGDLYGILNGIDTEEWDPERDPLIFAPYSRTNPAGKRINKSELQVLCGFERRDVPLIGMVSRVVEQKGFDLLLELRDEVSRMDCQWVFLGRGQRRYESALAELARQRPDRFYYQPEYNQTLAHRIQAGCDMALIPSRFEPCGLSQMYGMRYGAVPVVRHTGGLADTVQDFHSSHGNGNGFKFYDYGARSLLEVLHRAVRTWEDRTSWSRLVANAMSADFSWDRSAEEYVGLYRRAIGLG